MINFGIRQSFDTIQQVEERFSNLKVPVEIALPYYWDIYEPIRAHLKAIAERIKSFNIDVLGIHSVQAPITSEKFKIWGKEIADFARILDAKIITLHPNNINKSTALQQETLNNLEYFNMLYKKEIIFSIETFSGRRRIFTPEEIVKFNLPMTLDIAHINDNEKIWSLLKNYKWNILNIHLSAKENNSHHLPIDTFCKEVVDYLVENRWGGNVILEYLPEFHARILNDLRSLTKVAIYGK